MWIYAERFATVRQSRAAIVLTQAKPAGQGQWGIFFNYVPTCLITVLILKHHNPSQNWELMTHSYVRCKLSLIVTT